MGLISSLIKYMIKYGIPLLIGSIVILNVVAFLAAPVLMNPSMPPLLRTIGVGVPLVGLVGSIVGYLWKRDLRIPMVGVPASIAAPWVVLVLSWVLLLPQFLASLSLFELVFVFVIPVGSVSLFLADVFTGVISGTPWVGNRDGEKIASLAVVKKPLSVGGFQVVASPQERVMHEERTSQREVWEDTASVLRSMVGNAMPLVYRLERVHGATREYYLTLGEDPEKLGTNVAMLERSLVANLRSYRFEKVDRLDVPWVSPQESGAVVCLKGEPLAADDPQQRGDPLTVLAEAMLRQDNAVLQVSALPVQSGLGRALKRVWTDMEYKSKASQAQVTRTREKGGLFFGGSQESTVHIDPIATDRASRAQRELDRLRAQDACRLEVSIACWDTFASSGRSNARLLMDILRGVVRPADASNDLTTRVRERREDLLRLLRGEPVGEFTQLRAIEAAHLLTLPQTDIGAPLTRRSAFATHAEPLPETTRVSKSLAPAPHSQSNALVHHQASKGLWVDAFRHKNDIVILGNPLRASGDPIVGSLEWFRTRLFGSHFGIYGNTRSGKTWTAFMIAAQAMKRELKTTIVVPRKPDDWLPLLHLIDNIWVFTPGDPDSVPFRINMFNPPTNVPLALWMTTVVQILSGLLPSDRVMTLHFDDIVHTAYRNCGWDAERKIRGRPVLLSDLWDAVEEVSSTLDYGNELRANFYGALTSRIKKMLRNHTIVDMYNTEEGITWEQLAGNNVILDMQRLPREDRAFLMGLVAAGLHMYKSFNSTREITNLLVLEEASYILKPSRVQDLYGPDASQTLLHLMVDMFTTSGGNGLGTMTIEQLPSRLAPEVVKLIVNVVSHAIGDDDERRLVAGHMGVEEGRRDHLQQMDVGEVLVYLEGAKVPKNVMVWPVDKLLDAELPRAPLKPEQIREHMGPILERHENLRSVVELPSNIIARLERVGPMTSSVPPEALPFRGGGLATESSLREYQTDFDGRIRAFAYGPAFLDGLGTHSASLRNGNIEPLVNLVVLASEDLAGDGLDQSWVAERLAVHSKEVRPDLVDQVAVDSVLARLKELLGEG